MGTPKPGHNEHHSPHSLDPNPLSRKPFNPSALKPHLKQSPEDQHQHQNQTLQPDSRNLIATYLPGSSYSYYVPTIFFGFPVWGHHFGSLIKRATAKPAPSEVFQWALREQSSSPNLRRTRLGGCADEGSGILASISILL